MWEADDAAARWTHGLCGVPVLAFILFDGWLLMHGIADNSYSRVGYTTEAEGSALAGALYLEFRLLWYAFTGRNCINRDDYD